jgi:pentapeptide repeat protein
MACPELNIRPDLMGAALTEANLAGADLHRADLSEANLCGANLHKTDLGEADLVDAYLNEANLNGADLFGANLVGSDLVGADLVGANLSGANLTGANLGEANLRGADLRLTHLVQTDLTDADLTGCRIYGLSAWGLKLERAKQQDLVITRADEPEITVDNIEVAQFVYLLLHNEKIREVIDTITSKAVLILGRFIQERKPVLEALREELRQRKYLPILFDFEKPRSRNTDETITLLARMARFVVADISDAKSVLQELRAIVPDLPSVPVQPIILAMQEEPGMFDFYRNFRSFLNVHRYASQEQLIADLGEKVIRPAELKVLDLQGST